MRWLAPPGGGRGWGRRPPGGGWPEATRRRWPVAARSVRPPSTRGRKAQAQPLPGVGWAALRWASPPHPGRARPPDAGRVPPPWAGRGPPPCAGRGPPPWAGRVPPPCAGRVPPRGAGAGRPGWSLGGARPAPVAGGRRWEVPFPRGRAGRGREGGGGRRACRLGESRGRAAAVRPPPPPGDRPPWGGRGAAPPPGRQALPRRERHRPPDPTRVAGAGRQRAAWAPCATVLPRAGQDEG